MLFIFTKYTTPTLVIFKCLFYEMKYILSCMSKYTDKHIFSSLKELLGHK